MKKVLKKAFMGTLIAAFCAIASVCGIMVSHPAARYFAVGNISREQFIDYASRRRLPPDQLHKFLFKNIGK